MSTQLRYRVSSTKWDDVKINKINLSQEILDYIHPIGSIYISHKNTSPATLFGGTWIQITNRFIRAANDINIGGEDTHTLTIAEMPTHNHRMSYVWSNNINSSADNNNWAFMINKPSQSSSGDGGKIEYVGNSQAHNNMPAYQDLYVWYRSA